jgi:hypothetical protein
LLIFKNLRITFNIKIAHHFLTESEWSEERLLEAARRVSGSESITGLTGWGYGLWILNVGLGMAGSEFIQNSALRIQNWYSVPIV